MPASFNPCGGRPRFGQRPPRGAGRRATEARGDDVLVGGQADHRHLLPTGQGDGLLRSRRRGCGGRRDPRRCRDVRHRLINRWRYYRHRRRRARRAPADHRSPNRDKNHRDQGVFPDRRPLFRAKRLGRLWRPRGRRSRCRRGSPHGFFLCHVDLLNDCPEASGRRLLHSKSYESLH